MAPDHVVNLVALAGRIEEHMERIEGLLPKEYKLTLVARHISNPRAHIVMTVDDVSLVGDAIRQTLSDPNGTHITADGNAPTGSTKDVWPTADRPGELGRG